MKFPVFAMGRSKSKLSAEKAQEIVDKWLTINAKGDEATIEIDGVIGDDWFGEGENTVRAVKKKIADIANLRASKITVNINSLGGDVSHGLGIHDVLAQHKAKVTTNVQGMTASAATIIAQAGDTRKMSANALYLIHQPWSIFLSNVTELEQDLNDMKTVNDRLVSIYTKRSGTSEEKIRSLMDENNGNGKWISADEALEMGLIDETYEPMRAAAFILDKDIQASLRLPDLPQSEEKEDNQIIDVMKKTFKNLFADLQKWFDENFKKEGSDEIEIPEAAQKKLAEFEAKINELPEDDLQASVDSLTAERDSVQADLEKANDELEKAQADLEAANKKATDLESEITKLKAKSTKIEGKQGGENADDLGDENYKNLSEVIASMKGN